MNKNLTEIISKKNPNRIYVKQNVIEFSKETLIKEIKNAKYTLKH